MLFKPGLTNYAKESVKQEKKQVTDTRQDALTFAGIKQRDEIDEKMGFAKFLEGQERLGWLVNIQEV
jgi:DNA polymerase epsilon subunit 1